ncbi:hypothetical protein B0T14DRAFT_512545, partial [Immersiella caudata]
MPQSLALATATFTATDAGPTMGKPPIFLRLPAELRMKIFRSLYWRRGNPRCGGAFAPSLHTPLADYPATSGALYVGIRRFPGHRYNVGRRTHKLETLTSLMLVCKLFYFEVLSIIYDRAFGFFDLPFHSPAKAAPHLTRHAKFNTRFFFDGGPARHLRCVRVKITNGFPYPRKVWPPAKTWDGDPMIAAEELLWSLARNATGLETLELDSNWSLRKTLGVTLGDHGRAIAELQHGFSWANPVLGLDLSEKTPGNESRADNGDAPSRETLMQNITELLAPGNAVLQEAMRERLEARSTVSGGPVRFSGFMQATLYLVDCARLFWGIRLLGILKGFSPTLRTVRLAYAEDKEWMAKMGSELGMEVTGLPSKSGSKM